MLPQSGRWLQAARLYLFVIVIGNMLWEAAQFPLYTIWYDGTRSHMILALVHGTLGDLFISAAALMTSLAIFGHPRWPACAFWRVGTPTVVIGLAYTVYSEWVNVVVRHTWAYTELMPTLPPLGTGLSPLLEWAVVPLLALLLTQRNVASEAIESGHPVEPR
jgi:hypothetical protein